MTIEQQIINAAQAAVKELYGQDVPEKMVQLQKTKKEFEGNLTLVVFPFLKISRKKPDETAREIGEYIKQNCEAIADFNAVGGFLNLVIDKKAWLALLNEMNLNESGGASNFSSSISKIRQLDSGELRYHLVVCGSSQRMMQRFVLDKSDPLYGRAHERMNLRPIRPQYWQEVMRLDAVSTIEEYSVWGGVPRYWALREEYGSFCEAVEELVLDEHGMLNGEPSALFVDEASDIAPFQSIMTAIGHGNTRYSAVASVIGKKTTEISKPLSALVEMSYICKDVPFGESEEKTKKTLYVINDNFMAFYYTFIEPHRSMLALGRTAFVMQKIRAGFPAHVGKVWEQLCQAAVSGNELFGHTWNMARRWWGKVPVYKDGRKTPVGFDDLEFDVVAEAVDAKDTILVGECKWKAADYADRLLVQLKAKAEKAPFAQGKKIVYVLFLKEPPLSAADCHVFLPDDVLKYQPE